MGCEGKMIINEDKIPVTPFNYSKFLSLLNQPFFSSGSTTITRFVSLSTSSCDNDSSTTTGISYSCSFISYALPCAILAFLSTATADDRLLSGVLQKAATSPLSNGSILPLSIFKPAECSIAQPAGLGTSIEFPGINFHR